MKHLLAISDLSAMEFHHYLVAAKKLKAEIAERSGTLKGLKVETFSIALTRT